MKGLQEEELEVNDEQLGEAVRWCRVECVTVFFV